MSFPRLIRWGGLAAMLGGMLGILISPFLSVAWFATQDGAESLENPLVAAWIFVFVGFLVGLLALHARQASRAGPPEKWGFSLALAGTVLSILGILGAFWAGALEFSYFAFLAPGQLLMTFGSTLFGIGTLLAKVAPRLGAWLLIVGGLPGFLVIAALLAYNSMGLMLLSLAWVVLGYTLWSVEEVGWLQDRASLLAYRLRAAAYGSKNGPKRDLVGKLSLLLGIVGVLLGLGVRLPRIPAMAAGRWFLYMSAAAVTIFGTVLLWRRICHLGDLSRIMHAAAASSQGADDIRKNMAYGMLNADAYVQLRRLYEEPRKAANDGLRGKGWPANFEFVPMDDPAWESHEYATIVLPLMKPTTLENLLGTLDFDAPLPYRKFSQTAEARQALRRTWGAEDDETGNNYHVLEIGVKKESGSDRLVLDVGVATYGEIMRTCDALINEFALFAYITGPMRLSMRSRTFDIGPMRLRMRSRTFLHCLPWRRRTHEQEDSPGDIFLRPRVRAAGLGIAVATMIVDDRGDYIVGVGMRSDKVGTYPACLHVIPAGMCNTHGTETRRGERQTEVPDWFIRTSMRSEFQEEWYRDKKLEDAQWRQWRQYVDKGWKRRIGDKSIMLTGLAYDLLNLRPEICGVVVVDTWGPTLNWEYSVYESHRDFPLVDVGSFEDTKATNVVQSGAAALFLAQRAVLHKPGKVG